MLQLLQRPAYAKVNPANWRAKSIGPQEIVKQAVFDVDAGRKAREALARMSIVCA